MSLKRIRNGEYTYQYGDTSFYISRFTYRSPWGRKDVTWWYVYQDFPTTGELRRKLAEKQTLNECRQFLFTNAGRIAAGVR